MIPETEKQILSLRSQWKQAPSHTHTHTLGLFFARRSHLVYTFPDSSGKDWLVTYFTHLGSPLFPALAELMGRRESEGRRDGPCGWWPGVHMPLAALFVQRYPVFRVAQNVKAGRGALAQGPTEVPSFHLRSYPTPDSESHPSLLRIAAPSGSALSTSLPLSL